MKLLLQKLNSPFLVSFFSPLFFSLENSSYNLLGYLVLLFGSNIFITYCSNKKKRIAHFTVKPGFTNTISTRFHLWKEAALTATPIWGHLKRHEIKLPLRNLHLLHGFSLASRAALCSTCSETLGMELGMTAKVHHLKRHDPSLSLHQ